MGLKEVLANGEGLMFFIFDNTGSCNKVFEGGPWYMGNKLLILKKWKKMMRLTKEHVSQIPVWVKFFNIPMEYWDHEGLSRIASKIGVPLFMDHLTSTGTRVSFARVCVEVDVTSKLPHQFFVRCEDEVVEIKVEYQGLPAKCEHCRIFGHDTKKCVTAQVEKLTQMQKVTEVAIEDEWQHVQDKGKKKVGVPEGDVQTVEHTPLPPVETAAKVVLEEGLNHVDDPLQLLHKEIQGLASALDTVAEAPSGLEEPVDEVDTEEEMLAAMVDKLSTPRKKARQQGETSRQNSSGKSGSQRKKKNEAVNCMHWFGDIVDPKGNDINGKDLYVRIHDSDQDRNGKLTHKSRSVIAIAAAAISTGLLLICSFGYVLKRRMRSRGRVDRSAHELDANSKASVDDSNNGELL